MDLHHLLLAGLPAHTASPPEADMTGSPGDVAEVPVADISTAKIHAPCRRRAGTDLPVAIDFAIARAQSTKSCATGVRVRFFNVTIPTDPCVEASSIGSVLTRAFPPTSEF